MGQTPSIFPWRAGFIWLSCGLSPRSGPAILWNQDPSGGAYGLPKQSVESALRKATFPATNALTDLSWSSSATSSLLWRNRSLSITNRSEVGGEWGQLSSTNSGTCNRSFYSFLAVLRTRLANVVGLSIKIQTNLSILESENEPQSCVHLQSQPSPLIARSSAYACTSPAIDAPSRDLPRSPLVGAHLSLTTLALFQRVRPLDQASGSLLATPDRLDLEYRA